MKRDLIDLSSLSAAELNGLLALAIRLKSELKSGLEHPYLRGNTLAMIFQKPSLRTRITFETGMAQLGGHAIYLAPQDIGIGERESVKDVARNLSRWVDLIMIRTFSHSICVELAQEASVPVINGLTDLLHPCQLMADLMTLREIRGDLPGSASRLSATASISPRPGSRRPRFSALSCGWDVRRATSPKKSFVARLRRPKHACSRDDPAEAVAQADAVYTDSWISMGQEKERRETPSRFQGLSGESRVDEEGRRRRSGDALPAGASRRRDHR